MNYLIILLVVVVVFTLVKKLIVWVFCLVRDHIALCLILAGLALAYYLGGIYAIITGIAAIFLIILAIGVTKKVRELVALNNKRRLESWLRSKCSTLGLSSNVSLEKRLPAHYKNCIYPKNESFSGVITGFLMDCNNRLRTKAGDTAYELIRASGIIDVDEVISSTIRVCDSATHSEDIQFTCRAAIKDLVRQNKVDYPTFDKQHLHCVGVSAGANLESEEIEIEI